MSCHSCGSSSRETLNVAIHSYWNGMYAGEYHDLCDTCIFEFVRSHGLAVFCDSCGDPVSSGSYCSSCGSSERDNACDSCGEDYNSVYCADCAAENGGVRCANCGESGGDMHCEYCIACKECGDAIPHEDWLCAICVRKRGDDEQVTISGNEAQIGDTLLVFRD